MPGASYEQSSFLGGEVSQSYAGRYDKPDYKISLARCLNWLPIETGALVRRGGTQFFNTTRSGLPGRVITFDVQQSNPITLEFTDNHLRFWSGAHLITTNDSQGIVSISAANPAVLTIVADSGWQTGDQVYFTGLGTLGVVLQNRLFTVTRLTGTTYSLADAITGTGINGATLGTVNQGTAFRAKDVLTNYGSQSWQSIRSVQAEKQAILLNGTKPQVLTEAAGSPDPTFSYIPINFIDGPYLDPPNGSVVTYSALVGNITLTFSFVAWSSTISYNIGDYVLSGGLGYKSIVNANLNNTPPNASFWTPVQGGDPVGPQGFTAGDIGRHIRLFSEPPPWSSLTAYTVTTPATIVKYNGAYYSAIASSTNVPPGTDATKWLVVSGAAFAVWTWGRILSVSGTGLITPGVAIGNYTTLSAAFDGTNSKAAASCATGSATVTTYPAFNSSAAYNSGDHVYFGGNLYQCIQTFTVYTGGLIGATIGQVFLNDDHNTGHYWKANASIANNAAPNDTPTTAFWTDLGAGGPTNTNVWSNLGAAPSCVIDVYAGQDFHLSPKAIAFATVYPSTDKLFGTNLPASITFNLRASNVSPATPSSGTLLGTTVTGNTLSAITINSNDSVTTYSYFWVEMTATQTPPLADNGSHTFTITAYLSQATFFAANVNNGSVVVLQLAGPPLLYTVGTVINTWRPGVYSDAAGWPTCGTYAKGRLWLAGALDNRFDASMSNQLFTFSPTGPDGTVAANNAISAILNAPDVNPILWMVPDQQGVLLGTQKREWLVVPASTASGIAPTNIDANPVTNIGTAFIEPRRTEHTLVYVHRRQRKIMEAFPDVFSGKFTAPNLNEKSRHLTGALIQEIAYQQELTPTIWARCGDGTFFGMTYKRDTLMTSQGPTFIAAHPHRLGSGRLVESITVSQSQNGTLDALTMVTNDPATGIRHVERLTDFFEETNLQQNAWQLDDAVTPTSTSISNVTPAPYGGLTINGLWHLNGKAVQVFAGGLDCGLTERGVISDFVVSNGSVTVPFGDGVSAGSGEGLFTAAFVNSFTPSIPIVVGFAYNSDAQMLRQNTPQETGARNGPAFAKKRRNHWYGLQVVNTQGISVGVTFAKLDPVIFTDDTSARYPDNQLFSGVQTDTINDTYSFDGQICWRASRVQPAMMTVIGGFVETTDK